MNKLQGNRAYIEPDSNPAVNGLDPINPSNDNAITNSIRIEVYKGSKYQGKKIFSQDRIIIGKNLEADLVLSDDEIADKHACITYIDDQLVILDRTQKKSLAINGGLFGISIIDPFEQVGLGPYILKISLQQPKMEQESDRHIPYDDYLHKGKKISLKTSVPFDAENLQVDSLEKDQEELRAKMDSLDITDSCIKQKQAIIDRKKELLNEIEAFANVYFNPATKVNNPKHIFRLRKICVRLYDPLTFSIFIIAMLVDEFICFVLIFFIASEIIGCLKKCQNQG